MNIKKDGKLSLLRNVHIIKIQMNIADGGKDGLTVIMILLDYLKIARCSAKESAVYYLNTETLMEISKMAKRANEIIAFHLGWNITDVSEGRYQHYTNPAIYVCGDDYYCCPTNKQKLPKGFKWIEVGNHYNRAVFIAKVAID